MTSKNLFFHGIISFIIALPMINATGTKINTITAPKITAISWGSVTVTDAQGAEHKYKDCLVYPTGSKNWDWRLTGTEHVPGIQIADLNTPIGRKKFIDAVDIVILSRGMHKILQVQGETLAFIESLGKEYHVEETEKAVKLYNTLVEEGKKVGALIHSTC